MEKKRPAIEQSVSDGNKQRVLGNSRANSVDDIGLITNYINSKKESNEVPFTDRDSLSLITYIIRVKSSYDEYLFAEEDEKVECAKILVGQQIFLINYLDYLHIKQQDQEEVINRLQMRYGINTFFTTEDFSENINMIHQKYHENIVAR